MANKMIRQHDPLRVPQDWKGQDRSLVIQLEHLLTDLYRLTSETENALASLKGDIQKVKDGLGTASAAAVYNGLNKDAEGFVLDARQGKVLNDSKIPYETIPLNSDASRTFTLANSSRIILFFISARDRGIGVVNVTSTGDVRIEPLGTFQYTTFNTATANTLTIATQYYLSMYATVFQGSIT